MTGRIDLEDVTCDSLKDEGGRLWPRRVTMCLDHLVYRQASRDRTLDNRRKLKRRFEDWVDAHLADWSWPFETGVVAERLRKIDDYWQPWHVRRNWLYRQFEPDKPLPQPDKPLPPPAKPLLSPVRHRIKEVEYRPQPFEQAVRAARAEGQTELATHIEMQRQRIEWRMFNRRHRWWLGGVGITLAAAWLIHKGGGTQTIWVLPAWAMIVWLMLKIPDLWKSLATRMDSVNAQGIPIVLVLAGLALASFARFGWPAAVLAPLALVAMLCLIVESPAFRASLDAMAKSAPVRWLAIALPFAVVVGAVFFLGGWDRRPLDFLVAALIFTAIRFVTWTAGISMRLMFGYLRRPTRAIATLIGGFVVGWIGVAIANGAGMLVIDAAPAASVALYPSGRGAIGLAIPPAPPDSVRNLACGKEIDDALYALDVMVPLIDLRQESRCEVGIAEHPARKRSEDVQGGQDGWPERLWRWGPRLRDQIAVLPQREGYWEVLKALYAILGWLIVSLSIITFANVYRTGSSPS